MQSFLTVKYFATHLPSKRLYRFYDILALKNCQTLILIFSTSQQLLILQTMDTSKRFRDASRYTSKKISLKLLFLSDIFLFPFVRQQFPILAYRCSWRQCCCFVDNIGYIFKEVNTLQSAGACKRIEHGCPFGTSMRPEEK